MVRASVTAIVLAMTMVLATPVPAQQEEAVIEVQLSSQARGEGRSTGLLGREGPAASLAGVSITCNVYLYNDLRNQRFPDATESAVRSPFEPVPRTPPPPGWLERVRPNESGVATFVVPRGTYTVLQKECFHYRWLEGADCCTRIEGIPELERFETVSGQLAFLAQTVDATDGGVTRVEMVGLPEQEPSTWDYRLMLVIVLAGGAVAGSIAAVRWLRPIYWPKASVPAKSLPPETDEEKKRRRVTFEDVFGDAIDKEHDKPS